MASAGEMQTHPQPVLGMSTTALSYKHTNHDASMATLPPPNSLLLHSAHGGISCTLANARPGVTQAPSSHPYNRHPYEQSRKSKVWVANGWLLRILEIRAKAPERDAGSVNTL